MPIRLFENEEKIRIAKEILKFKKTQHIVFNFFKEEIKTCLNLGLNYKIMLVFFNKSLNYNFNYDYFRKWVIKNKENILNSQSNPDNTVNKKTDTPVQSDTIDNTDLTDLNLDKLSLKELNKMKINLLTDLAENMWDSDKAREYNIQIDKIQQLIDKKSQ